MPAAIDTTNGESLFASFREPAWHRLGKVFDHEVTDSAQMLDLAGLSGWNIRLRPLETDARPRVPSFEVVRDNPTDGKLDRLGVVGKRYGIVQNEDAFAFLQSLHDGARWETAGAIMGGTVVFGAMAFDRDFTIDESGVADVVRSFLLVYTSHDGSTGVAGGVTPVRVVCKNTLNVAQANIKQTFKTRHTTNVEQRMEAEAALWREANTYMDSFEAEAQALFAQPVTDKQFFDTFEALHPKPEKDAKGSQKKWESALELRSTAWKMDANAGIRGTGWGAFNALTEANQWGRKVRSGNTENFYAAGAGFDGPTNAYRNAALTAVKALA